MKILVAAVPEIVERHLFEQICRLLVRSRADIKTIRKPSTAEVIGNRGGGLTHGQVPERLEFRKTMRSNERNVALYRGK